MPPGWQPPFTFEEKLKHLLVPPALYMAYKTAKERRRGEAEFNLIPFLSNRNKISIDAGANVGTWTWEMARHAKAVHAFEPNPKNITKLTRNVGGLGTVTVHGTALSDHTGEAVLRIPKGAKGHSNQRASLSPVAVGEDQAFTPVRVDQKRLDDFDFTDVGFIKIDVEGFELPLLEGARGTIARDRPNLLIEMEEIHAKRPVSDLVQDVMAFGYRCLYLKRGQLTSFSRFDAGAQHTNPARREDYVFNFIFVPE